MTRDPLPAANTNDETNMPTVAQVMAGLHGLHAKLAFVRRASKGLWNHDQGMLPILGEILDGLESVANDLDVIGESSHPEKMPISH